MTDQRLTDELVARGMGWRVAPDRYIKPGRSWIPRSKFRPLADIRDALRLVDAFTDDYTLLARPGGIFSAQVRVAGRIGTAAGEPKARTVCLAIARAIGMEVGR